ncbi:response regulator transcription factor [Sediminibacterium sp.]|uniref:response regulator transcription factor n=1 Tax=Sediminibacterium sp. TaxID=1917865 RepID=UPI0011D594C5|nr:response regulator transcription factor [Sediminibacterium sp.]KAF0239791.1 MAG: PhoB family transcriptional [Chitinophagaceae bacterium]MDP1818241.1 response regulator transcription factor [Leadbetterella sp.]MDP3393525.1 response regulator transcription factor [Sediminibacterium sp.]MDP3566704.1 response regulator transcription factor [Sediminibacterium sp.]TXT31118.1 MAG: PhoB family transcriptional regulator [Chitinophagaceae bacterium]
MRIFLAEDETAIAGFLKEGLEEEGFAVDLATNGREALEMAMANLNEYDIILLDWMMPGVSGIEICRNIRKENKAIPVIFLTAKDTVDDTVFGLEAGANDYLKKPFAFEELLARIRVLLRNKTGEQNIFESGNILLNAEAHQVTKNGQAVELTQKEFALLEYLLRNKGKVCRRTRIIEKIWDIHFDKDTSVIDVFINALRKKLDTKDRESFIQTIRGVGYRVNDN